MTAPVENGEQPEAGVEIGRYLVLGTGHLRCATGEQLERWARLGPADRPLMVASTYWGWLVATPEFPEDEGHEIMPELREIIAFARSHGCDYVLLDCDGPVVPALPTYPW